MPHSQNAAAGQGFPLENGVCALTLQGMPALDCVVGNKLVGRDCALGIVQIDSHGVNIPTVDSVRLPTQCYWMPLGKAMSILCQLKRELVDS